jgi:hypothetical protein
MRSQDVQTIGCLVNEVLSVDTKMQHFASMDVNNLSLHVRAAKQVLSAMDVPSLFKPCIIIGYLKEDWDYCSSVIYSNLSDLSVALELC